VSSTTSRIQNDTPVEIVTGPDPVAAVIWLHGLGADGHDFEPIIPELNLPRTLPLRFVFPHAPFRPVTINNGYVMRAWYDLAYADGGLRQNPDHLRVAQGTVATLIRRENDRGIPSARIVLAGFSQGANVVLHAGLSSPEPVAGILALSAPVLDAGQLAGGIPPACRTIPVFLAHGTDDNLVPVALARQAKESLGRVGLALTWREYPMGHGVCGEEIADIRQWLMEILPAARAA
jgi:phospholipase/carboxylesterase